MKSIRFLISALTLQSAILLLHAQSPTIYSFAGRLTLEWCTNSSCSSTPAAFNAPVFCLPTVVNGNVYIPTFGITITGTLPAGCSASPCSGLVWYH
ncbi:MAG: hypothetical protein ABSG65_31820 [Bryobacteraceae bacterium]|jgi:hypothetical protein